MRRSRWSRSSRATTPTRRSSSATRIPLCAVALAGDHRARHRLVRADRARRRRHHVACCSGRRAAAERLSRRARASASGPGRSPTPPARGRRRRALPRRAPRRARRSGCAPRRTRGRPSRPGARAPCSRSGRRPCARGSRCRRRTAARRRPRRAPRRPPTVCGSRPLEQRCEQVALVVAQRRVQELREQLLRARRGAGTTRAPRRRAASRSAYVSEPVSSWIPSANSGRLERRRPRSRARPGSRRASSSARRPRR